MIEGNTMTKEEMVPFAVEIFVSDLDKVMNYYANVLGFNIHRLDKEGRFAALTFNDVILMIQEKPNLEELKRVGVVLRFIINNIEDYYEKVKEKGAIIYAPIKAMDYGLTRFKVKDPEGYIIKFSEWKQK